MDLHERGLHKKISELLEPFCGLNIFYVASWMFVFEWKGNFSWP